MKKLLLPFICILYILTGCETPDYLLSPLHSNSHPYYTIPVRADSIKSAIYANIHYTVGHANFNSRDDMYDFQGSLSRSHNFGYIQAYYAANITIGNYGVHDYTNTYISYPQTDRYFGAYGFNGGVNFVAPLDKKGSEFRVGIETSLQKEFGDYLNFRKSLPDSSIDILDKESFVKTVGIYFDFIRKARKSGNEIGYKLGFGNSYPSEGTFTGDDSRVSPAYVSNTFHFAKDRFNGFTQLNIGTKAYSFQIGAGYRLSKK
jgi:hypothetical protein